VVVGKLVDAGHVLKHEALFLDRAAKRHNEPSILL
jgi:hypothetical protein